MLTAALLLLPYIWISLVPACCAFTDWIYPGNGDSNLTFNYVDVVYFTWASSIDEPWMNLWCAPSSNEPQSKDYGKSRAQGYTDHRVVGKPKDGGLKEGDESSHCMKRNSVPLASANQWLEPSILPI